MGTPASSFLAVLALVAAQRDSDDVDVELLDGAPQRAAPAAADVEQASCRAQVQLAQRQVELRAAGLPRASCHRARSTRRCSPWSDRGTTRRSHSTRRRSTGTPRSTAPARTSTSDIRLQPLANSCAALAGSGVAARRTDRDTTGSDEPATWSQARLTNEPGNAKPRHAAPDQLAQVAKQPTCGRQRAGNHVDDQVLSRSQ